MTIDLSSLHLSSLTLIGAVTLLSFYTGSAAKFVRLPSLIGYMLLGVLLGPSLLNLFGHETLDSLAFITSISLGFVAFSIGSELNVSSLKHLGPGIVSIILAESLGAFIVVFISVYLLTHNAAMALIFGAMAPASAPAGTVAVIHEYKAKGNLTKALYAVVGFDDGLAIIIFGFAAAIAKHLIISTSPTVEHESMALAMLLPLKEIALSLIVGGVLGFLFCTLANRLKNAREIFILAFGVIVLAAGISIRWHLSLIMTNMVIGFMLANMKNKSLVHKVTAPINEIMPLIFVLFFCIAGAHLEIGVLPSLGLVGIVYIISRTAGLIGGARVGAMLGHVDEKVKKYVGLGILSQAGVAIGLALIMKEDLDIINIKHNLPSASTIGASVLTTITATCIFFEIIGPICTKIALKKAGEINPEKSE